MSSPLLVLGAGPAGLSAAYHLRGACEVFERNPYPGGHCHTHRAGGYCFDEGGHVFFGKSELAQALVTEPLADRLLQHGAEIWNHYEGRRFGRYPVQANAHALEPELATRCVLDFIEASRQPEGEIRNYEEFCHASFGRAFAE